jgi:hypothetical protein
MKMEDLVTTSGTLNLGQPSAGSPRARCSCLYHLQDDLNSAMSVFQTVVGPLYAM